MKSQEPEPDTRQQEPEPDTRSQGPEPDTRLDKGPDKKPGTEPDTRLDKGPDKGPRMYYIRIRHSDYICDDVSLPRWNQIQRAQ
jgi:hypothetical protein